MSRNRSKMIRAFLPALWLAAVLALPAQDRAIALVPTAEHRVALLIGNDSYAQAPLNNAVHDAQAMGDALKDLGFEVEVVGNADRRGADHALDRFIGRLGVNSVALFFYAGHGLQVEGENYLLGVDFTGASEEEAKYQGLPASLVMDRIQKTQARLGVLVLDACRDNPFRHSRGGSRGLAGMNAGRGSFIAFATSPGQAAADAVGREGHGLFTACLLESLQHPELELEQVFTLTREKVYAASGEKQLPWTSSSVIGSFKFRDLASQARRVAAEQTQLEAELAQVQAEKAAQQLRLGRTEAQEQEQDLKTKLRLKGLEAQGLAEEAERRRKRRAEASRLTEASRIQALQRQQDERAGEDRLQELKRRLEAERASLGPSAQGLEGARAEVARLTARKAEVEGRILAEFDRARVQLEGDYAGLALEAAVPLARDEFEPSLQHQAQLAKAAKARRSWETRMAQERQALEARYRKEAAEQAKPYAQQIEALERVVYKVPFQVELQHYDADRGQYLLQLLPLADPAARGCSATLKLAPEAARALKARAELLRAEGEGGLAGRARHLCLLDPVLGSLALQDLQDLPAPPEYLRNAWGMSFVAIPAGVFRMGGEAEGEGPRHFVAVPGFLMGKSVVTQEQWAAVMGSNPSAFKGSQLPVEQVSWEAAQAFLEALNGKEKDRSYRLPSEAEWEYACRAGDAFAAGSPEDWAWYGANSGGATHPVALKEPNAFGLFDMLGNVWEWCEDSWHDGYRGAPADGRAWGGGDSSRRVLRGGCWLSPAQDLRPSFRLRFDLGGRNSCSGLRLVCVPGQIL